MTRNAWRQSRRWFSVELFTDIAEAADLTMTEAAALYALSHFTNDKGACQVREEVACTRARMSRRTFQRAVGSLREKGVVHIVRTRGASLYFIPVPGNPNAHHTYAEKRQSDASRDANVTLLDAPTGRLRSVNLTHQMRQPDAYIKKGLEKGLEKGVGKGCGPEAPNGAEPETQAGSDPPPSFSENQKPSPIALEPSGCAVGAWTVGPATVPTEQAIRQAFGWWDLASGLPRTPVLRKDWERFRAQAAALGLQRTCLILHGCIADPWANGQKPGDRGPPPRVLVLRLALGEQATEMEDKGRPLAEKLWTEQKAKEYQDSPEAEADREAFRASLERDFGPTPSDMQPTSGTSGRSQSGTLSTAKAPRPGAHLSGSDAPGPGARGG